MKKFKTKSIYKINEQVKTEIEEKTTNTSDQYDVSGAETKLVEQQMIDRFMEYVQEFISKSSGKQQGYHDPSMIDISLDVPLHDRQFIKQLVQKVMIRHMLDSDGQLIMKKKKMVDSEKVEELLIAQLEQLQ